MLLLNALYVIKCQIIDYNTQWKLFRDTKLLDSFALLNFPSSTPNGLMLNLRDEVRVGRSYRNIDILNFLDIFISSS